MPELTERQMLRVIIRNQHIIAGALSVVQVDYDAMGIGYHKQRLTQMMRDIETIEPPLITPSERITGSN